MNNQATAEAALLSGATLEALLELARETVVAAVEGKVLPRVPDLPELTLPRGVFVSLHRGGDLRGCLGHLEGDAPVGEVTRRMAVASARDDPRFPPVTPAELADLDVEVSVLTAPREVPRAEDFIVGKHGIIIEKQGRRATFLPQVAPEQGWDRETTLAHLARKAGLPADAWRSGTRFWVYEAIVFGEKEH